VFNILKQATGVKRTTYLYILVTPIIFLSIFQPSQTFSQQMDKKQNIDKQVRSFLESRHGSWKDMNVPETDGKLLYDLIIGHNYKNALEIGTSTGHSSIWIAWALSKTGGKLITIEINEERYKEAVANFKAAGLSEFIDARLANAHKLVKELNGPFDFVFCDADKQWYKNYFIEVSPKLQVGGCYTAHNVSGRTGDGFGLSGTVEFYNYIKKLPGWETTVNDKGRGVSISYKKSLSESGH
jgi:caffeoyl-CoA O-methyltransferase